MSPVIFKLKFIPLTRLFCCKMSIFTQAFNPLTGKLEWEVNREDYDYKQEVARSAYADMLHDWERNLKYHRALKTAIDDLRKSNKPIRVLDIGTGSGLLAMMAARYGADSVYACEAFKPVADCANKVISDNGLSDKIHLIRKRSTDLTVGENGDLPQRATVLVTEVFDTELIGEGALSTFKHALENLLVEDCIVIPSSAVVFAQVVQSASVLQWHRVPDLAIEGIQDINSPESVKICAGAPSVHDIQLSELNTDEFLPLSIPFIVKRFKFTEKSQLHYRESEIIKSKAIAGGWAEVIFMWWEIEMYPGGEILSCAPKWAHPDGPLNIPWRDHWMQAIYYLPKAVNLIPEQDFKLGVHHDEYSFWFTVHQFSTVKDASDPPICDCGVHITNSRCRIGMMNDTERYSQYVSALQNIAEVGEKVCLCCGECIPLALIAGRMGFRKVYICESHSTKIKIIHSFVKSNGLEEQIQIIEKNPEEITSDDLKNDTIDVLLAEPFFSTSVLQWDNIHFWFIASALRKNLSNNPTILPRSAVVYGVAVQFTDLWKIRAPVRSTEGFNLSSFDQMIQRAIDDSDANVEPQPLWEYPSIPLGKKFELLRFNFNQLLPNNLIKNTGLVPFEADGIYNGIALWVDFIIEPGNVLSLGPTEPLDIHNHIEWYRYSQQGVHLPSKPVKQLRDKSLRFGAVFSPKSGKISFELNVLGD